MMILLPLALMMIGPAPVDHPHTYLLSIGRIPLRDTEHQHFRDQNVGRSISIDLPNSKRLADQSREQRYP
ncbi:hypothetical protein [Sphingomonas faeni]|uniref:hypothetical protein n=1 Tax=Sphingomonas faeni TaxID=185950 RepID=UPI0033616071